MSAEINCRTHFISKEIAKACEKQGNSFQFICWLNIGLKKRGGWGYLKKIKTVLYDYSFTIFPFPSYFVLFAFRPKQKKTQSPVASVPSTNTQKILLLPNSHLTTRNTVRFAIFTPLRRLCNSNVHRRVHKSSKLPGIHKPSLQHHALCLRGLI